MLSLLLVGSGLVQAGLCGSKPKLSKKHTATITPAKQGKILDRLEGELPPKVFLKNEITILNTNFKIQLREFSYSSKIAASLNSQSDSITRTSYFHFKVEKIKKIKTKKIVSPVRYKIEPKSPRKISLKLSDKSVSTLMKKHLRKSLK